MRISQAQLQRIIAEEYAKEEGIDEGKVEDLLAAIKGGPKPDWYDDKKETPPPPVPRRPAAETMPIPKEEMSVKEVVDSIHGMVVNMEPEDVAEIFQIVFEKLPGVEMQDAEPEPETLYTPGAEGRPQAGFKEELINKAYARILEMAGIPYNRDYHDMGGEDEMYDALDPQGFGKMSDHELMDAMHTDGMEDMIVRDGEGGLINREEVITALKNV